MAKRANGDGSAPRLRSDGRWQINITVGVDPETGKPKRRTIYGKTASEASRKARAACAAVDNGQYVEPCDLSLERWLSIWVDEYCGDLKERSRIEYRSEIKNHIAPLLGRLKISKLQPHTVQSWINGLQISPKSIKNTYGVLHRALEQAVKCRYIAVNPCDACVLPRIEKREMSFIAGDDLKRFIEVALKHEQLGRMMVFDVLTGLREGELLGLSWDSVSFERQTIQIRQQVQRIEGKDVIVVPKNSKSRTISPPQFVFRLLDEQRRFQLQYAFSPVYQNVNRFVFSREDGSNIARNTLYTNFKRIIREAELPDMPFHALRHTFVCFAIESGLDLKAVQEAVGHYSASFTADVYGHVSEQAKKRDAAMQETAIKTLLS